MLGAMSDQPQSPQNHQPPQNPPYGYPAPAPQGQVQPSIAGGSLGMVALIFGILTVLVSTSFQPMVSLLLRYSDVNIVGVASGIHGASMLVFSLITLVLGIIAVRTNARRLLGAVAIGIGAAYLTSVLAGWLFGLVFSLIL